ncbi:hypothetical protein L1049_003444 [Liquidambar formosana]|uniref:Uncharacterized protein n=1 Tax=Liquidambar formosana TaxID=63359 RepID=A0AAP0R316_LIQFO
MDFRLFEAIFTNDKPTFMTLVQDNQDILEQKTAKSLNTALHLATRFGQVEFVREIVKLRPDMVAAINEDLETPLHEACKQGNAEVLNLLLEANPLAACMLNYKGRSALFKACSNGHLHLVKLLLNTPRLLDLEDNGVDQTSLHVAAARGHTDIVREILNVRPNFASKIDKNGFSPLHYSSSRDHLEITKMLLNLNQELAVQYDNNGYTPVHLAAMNGKTEILKEFLSIAPTSFQFLTKEGETVFHLFVRFNQYDAFICLVQVFEDTKLINCPDQYGNTILHLAAYGKHQQLADYIINETTVNTNHRNNRGHTVYANRGQAGTTLEIGHLGDILKKVGGKRRLLSGGKGIEVDKVLEKPVKSKKVKEAKPTATVYKEHLSFKSLQWSNI